eukprot:CAMPEP_0184039038 /NCGR_PEP_ID=MMETSP0955-20130417/50335_1 /TAXON_ID=627963 /ORGANISM="Aplanochytrium sp, Strain PBS07" /LENGTH=146 /DNA_ID=CAMNT_0026327985 /DNA_START=33 /DNA_END=470 /DNA_ORIENTATION=+
MGVTEVTTLLEKSLVYLNSMLSEDDCFRIEGKVSESLLRTLEDTNSAFKREIDSFERHHKDLLEVLKLCEEGNLFSGHLELTKRLVETKRNHTEDSQNNLLQQKDCLEKTRDDIGVKAVAIADKHLQLLQAQKEQLCDYNKRQVDW